MAGFAASPGVALAQDAQARPSPAVQDHLRRLTGGWEGEGALMGRPARFRMCWQEALGGAFMRLSFANAFMGTAGGEQPAIESTAFYPLRGASRAGTWADSRGVIFDLQLEDASGELGVVWTGELESGRTFYRLTSDSTLEARDEVRMEGEYRAFARADLRRRDAACADR